MNITFRIRNTGMVPVAALFTEIRITPEFKIAQSAVEYDIIANFRTKTDTQAVRPNFIRILVRFYTIQFNILITKALQLGF